MEEKGNLNSPIVVSRIPPVTGQEWDLWYNPDDCFLYRYTVKGNYWVKIHGMVYGDTARIEKFNHDNGRTVVFDAALTSSGTFKYTVIAGELDLTEDTGYIDVPCETIDVNTLPEEAKEKLEGFTNNLESISGRLDLEL
jgi:hypothetical protein